MIKGLKDVRGWIRTGIAMLICYGFVWFTFTSINKGEVQAKEKGYQSAIGHAMKYVDVPASETQYQVVVVIDKWKGIAVIKKVPQNFEETEPLLVTDMMPSMMEPGFTFRRSGSSKE